MKFDPVAAICFGVPTILGVAFMLATWEFVFPPRGSDGGPVGPVYRTVADFSPVGPAELTIMGDLMGDECVAQEVRELAASGARVIRGDVTAAQQRCRIAAAAH